jgi:formylglycine-generating enzyme required for sulfatase activity
MKNPLILLLTGAICVLVIAGCPNPESGDEGTYRVSIADIDYGTITAEPRGGDEGNEITLTITPDDGFRLKGGSLKYQAGEGVLVTINSVTGKFRLPAANVTVSAEFEEYFRVNIPEALAAYIDAIPSGGPEGTEISLVISPPTADNFVAAGSLKYNDGYDDTPIDVGTQKFNLPPSDVTIYAVFDTMDTLIRKMIPVDRGVVTSWIGMTSGGNGSPFYNAGPDTPVTVEPYSIGATEVSYQLWYDVKTWAESLEDGRKYTWAASIGRQGKGTYNGEPTENRYHPVTAVSYWGAVVWCNAYSEWAAEHDDDKTNYRSRYKTSEGQVIRSTIGLDNTIAGFDVAPLTDEPGYRLPTRTEWEFAARGGKPRSAAWQYPYAGSDGIDAVAWYTTSAGSNTHPVGGKSPNTLGIYDMSGNINELVDNPYTYSLSPSSPTQYMTFSIGGSYSSPADSCQITATTGAYLASPTGGFRIAGPYQP